MRGALRCAGHVDGGGARMNSGDCLGGERHRQLVVGEPGQHQRNANRSSKKGMFSFDQVKKRENLAKLDACQ